VNAATTVMGFDYGARRIGIAVGNAISNSARALDVLANGERGPDWQRLDALLREWRPDALLVGLPLMLDDSEQRNSRAARAFAGELERRYRLPVQLVDERHSSQEAAQRFATRRAGGSARRRHAAELDAVAAEIIVERWLERA
jgi:putative pre-16S rRNA nuclease